MVKYTRTKGSDAVYETITGGNPDAEGWVHWARQIDQTLWRVAQMYKILLLSLVKKMFHTCLTVMVLDLLLKTMLHQSSGGAIGNIVDARITMDEWEKTNKTLFELLGDYCGKTAKRVEKDAQRDLWLSAEEALEYGIIDEVIGKK